MIKEKARVISQQKIATDIYCLWLNVSFAGDVKAGQFVSLYSNDRSRLLPRPISICEADKEKGAIRLVYRIAGAGTAEFSKLDKGDTVEVLGTLGNGFPLEACRGKRVLLMGGGIGIPPMLSSAKALNELGIAKSVTFVAGYRSSDTYLLDDLKAEAPVVISTDDGSLGTRGTVIDALREQKVEGDIIFSCGPMPMLKAIKTYAAGHGMECYVSLEERMACGIGACLGCITKSTEVDGHSYVKNKRICKDGPVFAAEEVDFS